MNYYYPLPSDAEFSSEDAQNIDHLPLCIVHFIEEERYALALTGGGMDLSWEICEAHMRLGYLPPTHFRLPRMAGMTKTDRNTWVLEGCRRSAEIAINWAQANLRNLDIVEEWLEQEGA